MITVTMVYWQGEQCWLGKLLEHQDLSQISIVGGKSEHRIFTIQWFTGPKTPETANLRQIR